MLPDLVSLTIFLRAVESRSLSKAASRSHLALAAASRRIAILESRYGVPLLYRSARGVEPTPAGHALAARAREVLQLAAKIDVELSDFAKGIKGHVRIEANTSTITQTLPADLASFSVKYPEVRLELAENRSGAIVQALREGHADVGIVMDDTPREGLACFAYRSDRLAVVVPRGHALRGRSVAFAKVLTHDVVGLDATAAMTRRLADAALVLARPLKLRMQVRSFEAVCKLVQAGMGIGILPEGAAANFVGPMGLRLVPLADAWAERAMYVCVRDFDALPVVARHLVTHLAGSSPNAKARLTTR